MTPRSLDERIETAKKLLDALSKEDSLELKETTAIMVAFVLFNVTAKEAEAMINATKAIRVRKKIAEIDVSKLKT